MVRTVAGISMPLNLCLLEFITRAIFWYSTYCYSTWLKHYKLLDELDCPHPLVYISTKQGVGLKF